MSTAAISDTNTSQQHVLTGVSVGPKMLSTVGIACLGLALAVAAGGAGWERFTHAYLIGIAFSLSVSLGALFFVILQHLTNAKWSVTIRRVAELMTSAIPVIGLLFLPILGSMFLGSGHLYEWNDADVVAHDSLIQHKTPFLNTPFFAVRCLIYFAAWIGMSRFFLQNSLKQDEGDVSATAKMRRYSGPAMLLFAITVNFASFDILMSLDPHWFSTIYGIYYFAGAAVALFATLPLLVLFLQRQGVLKNEVTVEHFHDLGKLLFGFVFFWTYIAFSQYLLIWYANIPEETGWFAARQNHGWQFVSLTLVIGHFMFPFAALMSRHGRRNRTYLAMWCVYLLVMHAVDIYWLIIPSVSPQSAMPSVVDGLCLVGVGAIWLAVTLRSMRSHRLLSTGDPNLEASLAFHNV